MGMKIEFTGLNEAKLKLSKRADMTAIKNAVRQSTVELQEKTKRNMGMTYVKRDYKNRRISTGFTQQHTMMYIKNSGLMGVVRPESEYFQYVELGTRYMAKEPTLKPALDSVFPTFKERIKKAAEGN